MQSKIPFIHSSEKINKWLKRIFTAGFFFFLIKGLIWIAAVVWIFIISKA